MPGSAEDFGIWKKSNRVEIQTWARPDDFVRYGRRALVGWVESWDSSLEEGSRFLVLPRRDQLESTKFAARLLKKLCLSLLVSKNLKPKKAIKSFVPILTNFVYFGIPYVHIHILVLYFCIVVCYISNLRRFLLRCSTRPNEWDT